MECTLQWAGTYPPKKYPVPCEDLGPHLTQVSLGTRVCAPNGISISSAVFTQFAREPNTQTTLRATYVAVGRIYALRAGNAA